MLRCKSHSFLYGALSLFLPIVYLWSVSSHDRNKKQHAMEGNGAPGKGRLGKGNRGKGKQFPVVPDLMPTEAETTQEQHSEQLDRVSLDQTFAQDVRANLPPHLLLMNQTRLLPSEWNTKVCLPHELGPKGGVALVKKSELAQVLKQVGQTTRATAIVMAQPAHELHMKGAPCTELWCTLQLPSETGVTTAYVKRYLIQLGMDTAKQVKMETNGLTIVQQSLTMEKVVIRFDPAGGWDVSSMSAIVVSDVLKSMISETAFDQIVIRSDGSATALIHKSCSEKLFKSSGTSHVFIKPHLDEAAWKDMEILWRCMRRL
jgi:hypothetical protein